MTNPKETWEQLGDVTARIMAKLEDDQRRVFETECKRDGVYGRQRKVVEVSEGVAK